jgi:hypothetical protein
MAKTTPALTGSKTIVEGFPAQIQYLSEAFLGFEDILAEAVVPAVIAEIDRIRTALVDKEPQYAEIVEDVTILWDGKEREFKYRIKGPSAQKAQELEYGPPAKSLLRHEVIESNKTLGKAINNNLNQLLGFGKTSL